MKFLALGLFLIVPSLSQFQFVNDVANSIKNTVQSGAKEVQKVAVGGVNQVEKIGNQIGEAFDNVIARPSPQIQAKNNQKNYQKIEKLEKNMPKKEQVQQIKKHTLQLVKQLDQLKLNHQEMKRGQKVDQKKIQQNQKKIQQMHKQLERIRSQREGAFPEFEQKQEGHQRRPKELVIGKHIQFGENFPGYKERRQKGHFEARLNLKVEGEIQRKPERQQKKHEKQFKRFEQRKDRPVPNNHIFINDIEEEKNPK